ncbi:hypothetical protein [Gracilibacillus suaedae]|uniref:hypothetical protein n=1 Tax=Gracilibacillus suaedae TaxID=2820273 RepID=UPI001ABDAC13|nr:hypothetical protein [Gracilibacillus suaedae]
MRRQKVLKWLFISISIFAICFVSITTLTVITDTEVKQTIQTDHEDIIAEERSDIEQRKKEKPKPLEFTGDYDKDMLAETLAYNEMPFPNDSQSYENLTPETFHEHLAMMENVPSEIREDKLNWLEGGLDKIPEEYRADYQERITNLKKHLH